jgi:hypothetical protein
LDDPDQKTNPVIGSSSISIKCCILQGKRILTSPFHILDTRYEFVEKYGMNKPGNLFRFLKPV